MSKKIVWSAFLLISVAQAQTVPPAKVVTTGPAPTVTQAQTVPPAKVVTTGPAPTVTQAQNLAARLMTSMTGPGSVAEVTYGLPAALPLKLPAPFEVVGAVRTRYSANSTVFYRVFASAPLGVSATRDALQKQLLAQGWKMPQQGQQLGFEGNYQPNYLNFYREGNTNFVLNANLVGVAEKTNIEMTVNPVTKAQLEQLKRQSSYASYVPRSSLPFLKALPGSRSKATYPTTGPSGSLSSVWVQTDRGAGAVFEHYSAQLRAAGWKALTDTTTGTLRVVTYSLKDLNGREALGTLGIRPWEKDGGYVLTVSVQGFKP